LRILHEGVRSEHPGGTKPRPDSITAILTANNSELRKARQNFRPLQPTAQNANKSTGNKTGPRNAKRQARDPNLKKSLPYLIGNFQ
jgi:hypothetical protein